MAVSYLHLDCFMTRVLVFRRIWNVLILVRREL